MARRQPAGIGSRRGGRCAAPRVGLPRDPESPAFGPSAAAAQPPSSCTRSGEPPRRPSGRITFGLGVPRATCAPPPRPDPRAPGLSRPPRGSALPRRRLAHFPGAASRGPLGSGGCLVFCFFFFPLCVWRFSPPSSPGFTPRGWIPGGVGWAGGGCARSAGSRPLRAPRLGGELECVRELPAGPRAPPAPGTPRALNKYLLNE